MRDWRNCGTNADMKKIELAEAEQLLMVIDWLPRCRGRPKLQLKTPARLNGARPIGLIKTAFGGGKPSSDGDHDTLIHRPRSQATIVPH